MSLQDVQIELENRFHKNQLMPRIKQELYDSKMPFAQAMTDAEIDLDFGFTLMAQMILRKRTNVATLVPILRRFCDGDMQATADMLYKACEADLVDFDPVKNVFIVKWDIDKKTQDDLDSYQFPMPMLVQPEELHTNLDSPYLTQKKASVILRDNHTDEDVCLDHLNRMNKIPLTINMDIARFIKNTWRHLDRPKDGESYRDYEKRVKAFEKYDRTAMDVMESLTIHTNVIYIPYTYDKRGRSYTKGYHVNPQGNAWNKAVVHFAERELVD